MPFIRENPLKGTGAGIWRPPFRRRWKRPMYAKEEQKVRLRRMGTREDTMAEPPEAGQDHGAHILQTAFFKHALERQGRQEEKRRNEICRK